jgi:hypothetical protein
MLLANQLCSISNSKEELKAEQTPKPDDLSDDDDSIDLDTDEE